LLSSNACAMNFPRNSFDLEPFEGDDRGAGCKACARGEPRRRSPWPGHERRHLCAGRWHKPGLREALAPLPARARAIVDRTCDRQLRLTGRDGRRALQHHYRHPDRLASWVLGTRGRGEHRDRQGTEARSHVDAALQRFPCERAGRDRAGRGRVISRMSSECAKVAAASRRRRSRQSERKRGSAPRDPKDARMATMKIWQGRVDWVLTMGREPRAYCSWRSWGSVSGGREKGREKGRDRERERARERESEGGKRTREGGSCAFV